MSASEYLGYVAREEAAAKAEAEAKAVSSKRPRPVPTAAATSDDEEEACAGADDIRPPKLPEGIREMVRNNRSWQYSVSVS